MKHAAIISDIEKDFVHPVRDPLWKHIYLSRPLERIIRTAPFLRLGSIKQLGPASLVYPGATHTRQNHSLGVYHLAKRIITQLLKQDSCPDLSLEGVKAFLTASLLHDLGHFPYAHVLEDDLALTDHEALSGQYILSSDIQKIIREDMGSDPLLTAAIVDQDLDYPHSPDELRFFRKLLSGVLDPDKLDYLNRDAYFCGIPYGIQDIDFVISQIMPHKENGMAIGPKGVMAVENILFSKYLMYKSVYWHKGVRTTSSIVKKALTLALEDGVLKAEELYPMDDRSFGVNLDQRDYAPLKNILKAETPWVFRTLYEETFDEQNFFHQRLKDRKTRHSIEKEIAGELSKVAGVKVPYHQVSIDVPRAISMEAGLPIILEHKTVPFSDSGTVFDPMVVSGFTRNLKKIRLIGPAELESLPAETLMKIFHA